MLRKHSNSKAGGRVRTGWTTRLAAGFAALSMTLVGCGESQPRDMLDVVSESADVSAQFYLYLTALVCSIFIFVAAWFIYSIVAFREREGQGDWMPPQIHGHTQLEIIWTIIPTLIVIAITIPTIKNIFWLERPWEAGSVDETSQIHIDVTGKQWWWEYDYIDAADADRKQIMFSTANEMHIPVDTMISLRITSSDVIHAFWVPRISGKRDATPGRSYPLYFKVNEPGEYIGQCAELCGASHALMGIKIFAHPLEGPNSYDKWLESQKKTAQPPTPATLAEKGKQLFITKGCTACHNIRGDTVTNAIHPRARTRKTGPDLTHVGSRTTIGALALKNTKDNLKYWIWKPQEVKQGVLMYTLGYQQLNIEISEDDAEALAEYLYRLK